MLVTPAGMVIEVKLDAPRNAPYPMLVTLSGMLIDGTPEYRKAYIFIFLRPLFNIIVLNVLLSVYSNIENDLPSIVSTLEGTVYYTALFPVGYFNNIVLFLLNNTPSRDE